MSLHWSRFQSECTLSPLSCTVSLSEKPRPCPVRETRTSYNCNREKAKKKEDKYRIRENETTHTVYLLLLCWSGKPSYTYISFFSFCVWLQLCNKLLSFALLVSLLPLCYIYLPHFCEWKVSLTFSGHNWGKRNFDLQLCISLFVFLFFFFSSFLYNVANWFYSRRPPNLLYHFPIGDTQCRSIV